MTPDEFRRHGREVVEWVARYMEEVERYPVRATVEPGTTEAALPDAPPMAPEGFDDVLADLDRVVMPGITHWQSPGFFAYFPANTSGPSILADLVCAGLGVQGMLWETSPACTEVETRMLDWMVKALALPERFLSTGEGGGVIQDSASSATLCALLAARERKLEGEGNRRGIQQADAPLVAYASTQAHSSIEKAVRIAGLGSDQLRRVAVDEAFAMRPEALKAAMAEDIAAGRRPFFVCATVGTTASGAFDPLGPIATLCREHQIWLHADGAMFGTAALCPEHRWIHEGIDGVDSYCFNPHKWMLTGFDCDCFWVADRKALIDALSILPAYLRNEATESGQVVDYRDWQIPLGRRFRSLKLWMVLRWYGQQGLRTLVRHHVALAQDLVDWLQKDERFELVAPAPLNLLCFRHVDGDDATRAVLEAVNASGQAFLTGTELDGRRVVRVSIGQAQTERHHVERLWQAIDAAG
jgi:aromatic-L-amino-acid decarboxylase